MARKKKTQPNWWQQLQDYGLMPSRPVRPPYRKYSPTANVGWGAADEEYIDELGVDPYLTNQPVIGVGPAGPTVNKTAPPGTNVTQMQVNPLPESLTGNRPPVENAPNPFPYQPEITSPHQGQYNLQDVLYANARRGYSTQELTGMLQEHFGDVSTVSAQDAATYLAEKFAPRGGRAPTGTSQSEWEQMQSGAQWRAQNSRIVKGNPEPRDWPAGMVSRGGETYFPVTTIADTTRNIPGPEPGTYLSVQPIDTTKGLLKEIKRTQQAGGMYKTPTVVSPTGEVLSQELPFLAGPTAKRDTGVTLPTVILGAELLPEGMVGVPEGTIGGITNRISKRVWVPETTPLNFVEPGTTWQAGENVEPYKGASGVSLGLGKSFDQVTFKGAAARRVTRTVNNEKVSGIEYEMQFERYASLDTANLEEKTASSKFTVAPISRAIVPGMEGYAVSTMKNPAANAFSYWAANPEQAAQVLGITAGELREKRWSEIGGKLGEEYARLASTPIEEGGLYTERVVDLGVWHESQFGEGSAMQLPEDQITKTPVGNGYYQVQTKNPVGMIVGNVFHEYKQGYGVNRGNLPGRERELMQKYDPWLAGEIARESSRRTRNRAGAIAATLASAGRLETLPEGTITPSQEQVEAVLARAQEAAIQSAGVTDINDVPHDVLQRHVIQQAANEFEDSPLNLGNGVISMSARSIQAFSTEGDIAGTEASALGHAFANFMMNFGNVDEEALQEKRKLVKIAQEKMVTGRNFKQQALRAYSKRVIGDQLAIDPSLPANAVSVSAEAIAKGYGLSGEDAESFLAAMAAGEVTPVAYVFGQPTPGGQVFAAGVNVVANGTTQSQLSRERRVGLSPTLSQALGRDADADLGYPVIAGRAVKDKNGNWAIENAPRVYANEEIQQLAREAVAAGRPQLTREFAPTSAADLYNRLDPSRMNTVTPDVLEKGFKLNAKYGSVIGTFFNAMEDVKSSANTLGLGATAEAFMRKVHGRTQGRFELPQDLLEAAQILSSVTPGGGVRTRLGEEDWGFIKARNAAGAMRVLTLELARGSSVSSEMLGRLLYSDKNAARGAELIEQYRNATGSKRTQLAGELVKVEGLEEQLLGSPFGQVVGSRIAASDKTTAESMGISQEAYDKLQAVREYNLARRNVYTKSKSKANIEGLADFRLGLDIMSAGPIGSDNQNGGQVYRTLQAMIPSVVQAPPPSAAEEAESNVPVPAPAGGGEKPPVKPPPPTATAAPPSSPMSSPFNPALYLNVGPGGQQTATSGGSLFKDESGGLLKRLPPVSATVASQALENLQYGLPLWQEYLLPKIQSGEILTSKEATFTRALLSASNKVQQYSRQQLAPGAQPSTASEALMAQIDDFQTGELGDVYGLLNKRGSLAAFQQKAASALGFEGQARPAEQAGPAGILANVLPSTLQEVSGIGPSRAEMLLGSRAESFGEVEQLLGGAGVSASKARSLTVGIANTVTPWQRLRNLASQGRLTELPGVGPLAAEGIGEALASGSIRSIEDLTSISGIGEKKALNIASSLAQPLNQAQEALGAFTKQIKTLNPLLSKTNDEFKKRVKEYEQGSFKPDKDWLTGAAKLTKTAQGIVMAADALGPNVPRGLRDDIAKWRTIAEAGESLINQDNMKDLLSQLGLGGPEGGSSALGRVFSGALSFGKNITSGWGLMQMNRMWGLTGRDTFAKYIPAAAQAGLQEWSAVQALSGFQGGLPQGAAGGTMQYMAAQQQASINAGRAGYRAWNWAQPVAGGLQSAKSIFGPAIGAGVMAGLAASWIPGIGVPASIAIGGAVAAGGSALAAGSYLTSLSSPTAENQLRLSSMVGKGPITGAWGALTSAIGRTMSTTWEDWKQNPLTAQFKIPGNAYKAVNWTIEQTAAGGTLANTPIGQLTSAQQMADIGAASDIMTGMEGTAWSGMDSGVISNKLAQWFSMDESARGLNQEQITTNAPEWMLSVDMDAAFQTARALHLERGGAMSLGEQVSKSKGSVYTELEWRTMGQMAPLTRFGFSGEAIKNAVTANGGVNSWTNMDEQDRMRIQQLASGSTLAWSRFGASIGRSDLQMLNGQTGMRIGSNWGGEILGGLVGQTAQPGVDVSGGMVNLGGQQVDFTRWSLQKYQSEERYADQLTQMGFSWQKYNTAGDWMQTQRALQDRERQMGYDWQQQQFGFRQEAFDLSNQQWMESFGLRRSRFEATTNYQRQNAGIQYGRQMTRFDWAEEDLAFSGQQAALQYGFGQEDIQQQLRYATGTQRRELLKQQQRQTIMYSMGMAQRDTQAERLDTKREWAEEDRDRQKSFFEEKIKWTEQEMDMALRHHEQDKDLAQRRMDAAKEHYEQIFKFQAERLEKAREYEDKQRKLWKDQLDFQEAQIKKWKDYQDAVTALNEAIDLQQANYSTVMNDMFAGQAMTLQMLVNWMDTMRSVAGGGAYIRGNNISNSNNGNIRTPSGATAQ